MSSPTASTVLQQLAVPGAPKQAAVSEAGAACVSKMRADGVPEASIRQFLKNFAFVESGAAAFIDERDIVPVEALPSLSDLPPVAGLPSELLRKTVVMKLNGGLGTGMGLAKAKSLLPVKSGRTFLDFIALQTLHLREASGEALRFMLLNSFSTSKDTRNFLAKYPSFDGAAFDAEIEVMQGKVPKIDRVSLLPAAAADPEDEWCPPGHGEIYTVLAASGRLDELLAAGYEYVFVSNSDNLGATLDTRVLSYFATRELDFLMEVCARTEADSKGGHLARDARTGGLLLREAAQCTKQDSDAFQNIGRHRFFNTNNIWFNLRALRRCIDDHEGVLPMPVICNAKTACATDPTSTPVFQLENAMGSAISLFSKTEAIVVPRSRFAPVKSCADLLSLRSDAYVETPDHRIELAPERNGVPPIVSLDDKQYKFISKFESLVANGVPSMIGAERLKVSGCVRFAAGACLNGDVTIENKSDEVKETPSGVLSGVIVL